MTLAKGFGSFLIYDKEIARQNDQKEKEDNMNAHLEAQRLKKNETEMKGKLKEAQREDIETKKRIARAAVTFSRLRIMKL
jgi:hypothetical protein